MRRTGRSLWTLALMLGPAAWAQEAPTPTQPAAGTQPASQADRWLGKPNPDAPPQTCEKLNGYHGIWYSNQPTNDEYRYKYSGGLGTYCAHHIPMAHYAPQADKTFFVYGGMPEDGHLSDKKRTLLICVSYYDHKTGLVPRPSLLMNKETSDAHDNPVLMLDREGYIYVFVSAHGTARPAYVFKSTKPYDIDTFRMVWETNFSYPQPWYIEGRGFLFLHTRYDAGRKLHFMTSRDGLDWSEPQPLAGIERGHYQVSARFGGKVGTAFNYHPQEGGLNARTNLYYIETPDLGRTWQTAAGEPVVVPLTSVDNAALVRDYASAHQLVYLDDITFDSRGFPVIVYVVSRGWEPGPKNNWRKIYTARWTGREWQISGLLLADNNYDTGCLHVEGRSAWRLIAPTIVGRNHPPQSPQPYNPGGEMMMWTSGDLGRTWVPQWLTHDSQYNHGYARRPEYAHPDFYAFWADGHGRQPSESRLYFTTQEGRVYRLPTQMAEEFARPEPMPFFPRSAPADPNQ